MACRRGAYGAGMGVDAGLVACEECGGWVPGGAADCSACRAWIETDLDAAWARALAESGVEAGGTARGAFPDADEGVFAEAVAADPSGVPWRVFDAALSRVRCAACGTALGSGPAGCGPCDLAHGNRFAAAEPDRAGVPPGNEHAIRVATAVVRVPHRFPPHMPPRSAYGLPHFIAGHLPSRATQLAVLDYLDSGGDVEPLRKARSFDEAHTIATGGR